MGFVVRAINLIYLLFAHIERAFSLLSTNNVHLKIGWAYLFFFVSFGLMSHVEGVCFMD